MSSNVQILFKMKLVVIEIAIPIAVAWTYQKLAKVPLESKKETKKLTTSPVAPTVKNLAAFDKNNTDPLRSEVSNLFCELLPYLYRLQIALV